LNAAITWFIAMFYDTICKILKGKTFQNGNKAGVHFRKCN